MFGFHSSGPFVHGFSFEKHVTEIFLKVVYYLCIKVLYHLINYIYHHHPQPPRYEECFLKIVNMGIMGFNMGLKFVQVESIWSRHKFNYADFISFLINYKWPLSFFTFRIISQDTLIIQHSCILKVRQERYAWSHE